MAGIDFVDIFNLCGLSGDKQRGNLCCPFCRKWAFTDYGDSKAHCHACDWSGNAIRLYADLESITYDEARGHLFEEFRGGRIQIRKKTYEEAFSSLAADLDFLARARLYFEFYKHRRRNKRYYQDQSGLSRSHFSKVINGDFDKVSKDIWERSLSFLRQSLDLKQLEADLNKGVAYWKDSMKEDGLLEHINRFK